jgi:hypothetical protein
VHAPSYSLVSQPLELTVQSGADWTTTMAVYSYDGITPLAVDDPVLEMRRDRTPNSQLLAHLDSSGQADGTIVIGTDLVWHLSMSAATTAQIPTGRGFWDAFGTVSGQQLLIASGVVLVQPRVTGTTTSYVPPTPPPPPIVVDTQPTEVDLVFPAGDDLYLDLALTEDDGSPADLSSSSATAVVTTSTGQVLASFDTSITDNIVHLHLAAADTQDLPASARWKCTVTAPDEVETVAAGSVRAT